MNIQIAINQMAVQEKPEKNFDWGTFNDNFENVDIPLIELVNHLYMGHSYCAHMDGRRCKENFVLAQHVAVDLDTGTYDSSFDALYEHPFVQAYGAIIHSTLSNSSAHPKSRVIFRLDEPITTLVGYEAAVRTIYEFFPHADPACIDGARFFFGNGKLSANKNTDGIWYSDLDDMEFPVSALRQYARQVNLQKQQKNAVRPPLRRSGGQPEPDLADIERQLQRVDPYAMAYDEWLRAIAGLKHQFGDAAYYVAKQWSDRPDKEPLTERKWASLRGHNKPATIASTYHIINQYGRRA